MISKMLGLGSNGIIEKGLRVEVILDQLPRLYFSDRRRLRFVMPTCPTVGIDANRMQFYDLSTDMKESMLSVNFYRDFTEFDRHSKRHAEVFARWIDRSHPGTIDRLIAKVGMIDDYAIHAYRGLAISQSKQFDFF